MTTCLPGKTQTSYSVFPEYINLFHKILVGIKQNPLYQNTEAPREMRDQSHSVAFWMPRILHSNHSFVELTVRDVPEKKEPNYFESSNTARKYIVTQIWYLSLTAQEESMAKD
jgi:hypothetical protein